MRGAQKNYVAKQGTHFEDTFTFTEVVEGETVPLDVSGYSFEAQARVNIEDEQPAFAFDFDLEEATNGIVKMYVDSDVSSALDLSQNNNFIFDVEYADTKGRKKELAFGKIKFIREITR